MSSRHPDAKADVVPVTTTTPTNTTTRRRGSWQGALPPECGLDSISKLSQLSWKCITSPSKMMRPRPRGGGFGLGAAGALLRAAGALPKVGRRERKAKEPATSQSPSAQTSSLVGEEATKTVMELEAERYSTIAVEDPVGAKEDVASNAPVESVASTCHESVKPTLVVSPCKATHIDLDEAPIAIEELFATDFLEYCLGGPAALLEAEMELAVTEDIAEESVDNEETQNSPSKPCQEFSMVIHASSGEVSESDEDEEGQDLEDMFDFDPAKLAELMDNGASMEELTDHLQESYACVLERRLSMDDKKETMVEADSSTDDGRPQLQMGDLTPLMTPEQVTPSVTPKGVGRSSAIKDHAEEALEEEAQRQTERTRRSLAMQHRPSATQRGAIAVKAMEEFGRRSLARVSNASAGEKELLEDAVVDAMRRASRRQRRSVAKAAEVLEEIAEASNVPLDSWSEDQIDKKVDAVQNAMEEAYRQHRRSITAAVRDVVTGTVKPATEIDDTKNSAVEARIREAVAAAHRRQQALLKESQIAEQWHEDSWANADTWNACTTYSEEWQCHTYDGTYWDTSGVAWNDVATGYESYESSKVVDWNSHAHGLRAPWRYGSA